MTQQEFDRSCMLVCERCRRGEPVHYWAGLGDFLHHDGVHNTGSCRADGLRKERDSLITDESALKKEVIVLRHQLRAMQDQQAKL